MPNEPTCGLEQTTSHRNQLDYDCKECGYSATIDPSQPNPECGRRIMENQKTRSQTTREQAVEAVDQRHGYALEYAPDQAAHRAEYDLEEQKLRQQTTLTGLAYALSIWPDTRQDQITREAAAQIAEGLASMQLPVSTSEEFAEGWDAAIETVAMALRFKDFYV